MSVSSRSAMKMSTYNVAYGKTGVSTWNGRMPVFLLVIVCLFVLDLYTRYLCFSSMCSTDIFSWFGLAVFRNYDFAFSIKLPIPFMYLLYAVVMWVLTRSLASGWKNNPLLINVAWLLVWIGAVANIFDRVYFGYVRDFIRFWNGYVNLGDIWIMIGVCLVCWYSLREKPTSFI